MLLKSDQNMNVKAYQMKCLSNNRNSQEKSV